MKIRLNEDAATTAVEQRSTESRRTAGPDSSFSTTALESDFPPSVADIESVIDQLQQTSLSPALQPWADRYAAVGHRSAYLWTWCRRGVEITSLSCVEPSLWNDLCDTKVLGVMLDVLIDDVADEHGDSQLLELLVDLPRSSDQRQIAAVAARDPYAQLTLDVWREIQRRVTQLPRYQELSGLLRYDYLQLMNAMRYSFLLNEQPSLLNLAEHDLYLPHNMHMMISATMDVMASPEFDRFELGRLREAVWLAQYMGRIGNLVTTWQREIPKRDFTSGVFAHAVATGSLRVDDLDELEPETIQVLIEQGGHEQYFLMRWRQNRSRLLALADHLHSVDLRRLVAGLEQLICLHLGSRGKK